MKKRKLEIRLRSTRPGVPAEEITVTNEFQEDECAERWKAIAKVLFALAEAHMGNDPYPLAGPMIDAHGRYHCTCGQVHDEPKKPF